ncbi:hypothetical protein Aab01nite_21960 [Paractinoplanes abujensis]|uniref:DUF6745 domain-containing protein n=1 Tax=Paractinoplanes abujensis TaxID=882441 RepID=A0A7W7G5F9_9ACTN|nr:hypothetical protein [Actinoplanes abujensis]MBB4696922.1 hypothetical protein [Actinoplanes abujensis]GID18606.1 hypothetical protein Aab01nite_21960 [Actinoplanes abujensis]
MRLTPEQEALAAAIEDQWLAAAVDTTPADRPAAEAGVREAYRRAGLTAPERIFWLGSPRAGAIAAALLSAGASPSPDQAPTGPAPDTLASGVDGPIVQQVRDALLSQGWRPGPGMGASVRRQVRTEPWAAARERASGVLGPEGWAQLGAAAGRRSWALVMDRVAGRIRLRLGEDLAAEFPAARPRLLDAIYGQHDGVWLSTFEAADRLHPGSGLLDGLTGLTAVARHCGWWWAGSRFAILTERPSLLARDNVGRLHRGEGPAIGYPDGYALWAWRGMPIPTDLAAELPHLTADRIGAESNAELRRVMLEHFGYERYLQEAGARALHQDETGTLWHLPLTGDEPLVMVEVVNATPEPDGTSRVYWLRVPPGTRTARAGVAWTFGLTADEYHPLLQT